MSLVNPREPGLASEGLDETLTLAEEIDHLDPFRTREGSTDPSDLSEGGVPEFATAHLDIYYSME
jgi:hypothetical protein